jgi:hypothetical protein
MKPSQYVLIWIAGSVSFIVILVTIFALIPENVAYSLLTEKTGFITEESWANIFMTLIHLTSFLLNISLIWFIAFLLKKRT